MFRLQTLLRDRLAECICWPTSVYFSFWDWRNQISLLCMKLRSITSKTSAHAYLEPIMKREQYFADEIYTNLYIAINLMSGSSGNQSRVPAWCFPWQANCFPRNLTLSVYCHSFKIFARFWLTKTTRIIHHNQLLLTKFGRNLVILNRWRQNDVKSAAWLQVIEPLTDKNPGTRFSCFGSEKIVVRTKWLNSRRNILLDSRRNIVYKLARTEWRRRTSAICSVFVDLNSPFSPKLRDKDALSIWTCIDQGQNVLACF